MSSNPDGTQQILSDDEMSVQGDRGKGSASAMDDDWDKKTNRSAAEMSYGPFPSASDYAVGQPTPQLRECFLCCKPEACTKLYKGKWLSAHCWNGVRS